MTLEELEDAPPAKRRRKNNKHKLIVDRRTKLGGGFLRERLDNPRVELRCEDSTDDIVIIRTSWEALRLRPARAGPGLRPRLADTLVRMFQRNLHAGSGRALLDRDIEHVLAARPSRSRRTLERIPEVEEPAIPPALEVQAIPIEPEVEANVLPQDAMVLPQDAMVVPVDPAMVLPQEPEAMVVEVPEVPAIEKVPEQREDISELITQKLDILAENLDVSHGRKRVSDTDKMPKRPRLSGQTSFMASQKQKDKPDIIVTEEPDKENIPPPTEQQPIKEVRNVSAMLQEAGLTNIQAIVEISQREIEAQVQSQARAKEDSNSETPLGSLDRTKVSLGDSVKTTDTQRYIKSQWGIEGTMVKILCVLRAGARPVSVRSLVRAAPRAAHQALQAAHCFTSMLKLKQHGFITITKDPESLEIVDVALGPRFDGLD